MSDRPDEEAPRDEFRALTAKLLIDVDALRDAVILAGELYGRTDQADEDTNGLISPARQDPRAEDVLSQREIEVLRMVADGSRNSEIAARLYIAETTVQSHVRHILHKLQVRNRTEAATHYLRGQHNHEPEEHRAAADD